MKKAILIILSVFMLLSCNLDSSQGIFQQIYNDSKKDYRAIQYVHGVIDNKIILTADNALYSFDGSAMTKEAILVGQDYWPIFAEGYYIYFQYKTNDGNVDFFSAKLDELDPSKPITSDFIEAHKVTVTIENHNNAQIKQITFVIQNLETIQVNFSLVGDNSDVTDPNKKVRHYGVVDRTSVNTDGKSFIISNVADVPSTFGIVGNGALAVYQEDSEMADGSEYLTNEIAFYYKDNFTDSTFKEIKIATENKVDADMIIAGYDGEFLVDMQGHFYNIEEGKLVRINLNSDDLIYRKNNKLLVFDDTDNKLKIGYLYEDGIYINDENYKISNNTHEPYVIPISIENDLQTACWIGKHNTDNKYLFATQENGFRIIELSDAKESNGKYTGSIHQYNAENDGQLNAYFPSSI